MRFWGLLHLAVFFVTCSSMRNHSNSAARSASQRLAALSRSWCSCLSGSRTMADPNQRPRRTRIKRQNSESSWSSMASFEEESDHRSRSVGSTTTETSRFYAWRAGIRRMSRVPAQVDAKSGCLPGNLNRCLQRSYPKVQVEKIRGTDVFIITERGEPNDVSKDFTMKILEYISKKDDHEPAYVEEVSGKDARGEYKSTTYKRHIHRPIQRAPTFPYHLLESDLSSSMPPETSPQNPRQRPSRPNQNPPPRSQPPRNQPPRNQPPRNQPPRNQPPRNQPPRNQPPRHQPPRNQPPRYQPSASETDLNAALIASVATEQPSAPVPEVPRNPRDVEAPEDASDNDLCCICMSNYKNAMMKPCGHLTICLTCAAIQQRQSVSDPPTAFNCAVCNSKVEEFDFNDHILRAATTSGK